MKKILSFMIALTMILSYTTVFADAIELFSQTAINILEESTERKVVISSNKEVDDATLYVAAYKADMMVDVISKTVDIVSGTNIFDMTPTWSSDDRDYVKIYLWDENLSPCAERVVITPPAVVVNNVYADADAKTVKVDVSIVNNPGISSMKLFVDYDEDLKLTDVDFNEAFGVYVTAPEPFANPQPISLISPLSDIYASGVFATLTFDVSGVSEDKDYANIAVICDEENTFDGDFEEVRFDTVNGRIIFDESAVLSECNSEEIMLMEANAMALSIGNVAAMPGETVTVDVSISENPGISSLKFDVSYDEMLTLQGVSFNSEFGAYVTAPEPLTNPQTISMISPMTEIDANGVFATLTFVVSKNATDGHVARITATYDEDNVFDGDYNNIEMRIVDGAVSVYEGIPGDINADGKVNNKDAVLHFRYVAGWKVEVDEDALDVTGDDKINNKDAIELFRYVAGWPGITLHRGKACAHTLAKTDEKTATCTEDGNIQYWHCSKCDKYYSDEKASKVITLNDTVVKAPGHTIVIIPTLAPTYTQAGLTEGKICSVCKTVIVKQETIPMLTKDEYAIIYYVANNDNYLKQQEIKNPNPLKYSAQDGLVLKNLIVEGYNFKGWYTAQTGGTLVTEIKKGETGDKELFAQWEEIEYTVRFACDMVPVGDITYKTSEGALLPTPVLDKYTFICWSDEEGNIWDNVPAGTVGSLTLYANWSSNRNQAKAVDILDDPVIIEDTDEGLILFTYEIGTIENVPLFTTLNLLCADGIITTVSRTEENSISTTQAETIAETISNATTNSSSWTLESNWNSSTEVSRTYLDQTGQTREEAETLAQSSTGTYNITGSMGGSVGNVATDTGAFKLSINNSHSETTATEDGHNFGLSVNGKTISEGSGGLNIGILKLGGKSTHETGINGTYGYNVKNTDTGTDAWSGAADVSREHSNTTTDEKTWNMSQGYSNSKTTSSSHSISNTVSRIISEEYGYGESYAEGGSNSEAQALASTDSKSDEYSTTMTYYTSEITSTTTSYSSTGHTHGGYRLVVAGTVHVFAVVGYDVADKTYFVYTYNVLDDKTEEYLDYSYDGTFDDYETSIIPFEVPYFVNQYVNARIAKTEGLMIDPDTGMIVDYIPDEDEPSTIIMVPSYVSLDNGDGTFKSVKVKGISPKLFKGNKDIVGVVFGNFIKEIPDSTFEGCSSLKYVICPGVTKIGDNAFSGCTSLNKFAVPVDVTALGENAFKNVPEVKIEASGVDVAKNGATAGAKNIVLDISNVPEDEATGMEFVVEEAVSFEIQGKDKEYKGLSIKSNAETTTLNGIKFTDCSRIPIELSSENVVLNRVNVTSNGYAMLLKAENTSITLNANNNLTSENGMGIVCRNIILKPMSNNVVGKLNVSGDVLVCGNITGEKYLNVSDGEIIYISEEEYTQYEKGMFTIALDANGGTVSNTSMTVYCGTTIGEIPTPTRKHFTFEGWFTKIQGGTQVTADSVYTSVNDITLYARWKPIGYTLNWNPGTGYIISVTRTASPEANASIGVLSNGSEIYYGDVLSVKYETEMGYSIKTGGETDITVDGNVTSNNIYATATVNSYTYNIVYKSSNGTSLGSATETHEFGTTNTITPKAFTGYTTPATQSVKWDSTSAKTVTFIYTPASVATKTLKDNAWWWKNTSSSGIKYTVKVAFSDRTANSVKATITWSNTITANTYYGYYQKYNMYIGNASTGTTSITTNSTWASSSSSARTVTKTSTITITGLSATQTSVSYNATPSAGASCPAAFSGTLTIPAY